MTSLCAVVPAAGDGTRLGLDVPKILTPLRADSLVLHCLHGLLAPHVDVVHVVMSPWGEPALRRLLSDDPALADVTVGTQTEPTGMGDAVFAASDVWSGYDMVLVCWGDQVNLSHRTLAQVVAAAREGTSVVLPLARPAKPYVRYEFEEQTLTHVGQAREGDLCPPGSLADVGLFALPTAGLLRAWTKHRASIRGRVTGEANLLPFLAYLSSQEGWSVTRVDVPDANECRGINTPSDLTFARERLQDPCDE